MQIKGLEELSRKLDSLSREVAALAGEHSIPFPELFPPQFMMRHTSFKTIDEMVEASGYPVESQEDFAAIPDEDWDHFVAENTEFASWEEMMGAAAEGWISSKLQL